MGGWASNLWWRGDPDKADPVSGLTRREVHAVQKSWAPVAKDPVASGTELFKRLFRSHPEAKELFRMVRKLPEEEYIRSPQFKAHVINVIFSLTQAVENLGQPEVVVAMMIKLGESHNRWKVQEKHFQVPMGGWLSYLWWGGDPDLVNPVSGLTKREVYAVQKSWAPVAKNSLANGSELLRRLFTTHPDTREFFTMVRKLPEEEYSRNPQFKAHVMNLMTSITQAVNNLNHPEVVAAMMVKLGESHSRRKIQEKHFQELKGVIVTMFIEVLNMDSATLGAWGKTVDFFYTHIFSSLSPQGGTR